jgi:molybdopterin-guanine dinucleotide biosynthesis protein A
MAVAHPLAAAILIGGQARRMGGADKSALVVGGVPILERQLAALRTVAQAVFLVGRRPPRGLPPGLRVVPDRHPGAGALGGIFTAITESPYDRTLVLGCDMPFVAPRLLERLAAEHADVVIPRTARGYEPLCAIYTKACAEGIRERIDHGELQASVLPAGVRVVELGPDVLAAIDPGGWMLANVNTPEDHERARSHADRIRDTGKGKE